MASEQTGSSKSCVVLFDGGARGLLAAARAYVEGRSVRLVAGTSDVHFGVDGVEAAAASLRQLFGDGDAFPLTLRDIGGPLRALQGVGWPGSLARHGLAALGARSAGRVARQLAGAVAARAAGTTLILDAFDDSAPFAESEEEWLTARGMTLERPLAGADDEEVAAELIALGHVPTRATGAAPPALRCDLEIYDRAAERLLGRPMWPAALHERRLALAGDWLDAWMGDPPAGPLSHWLGGSTP